MSILIDKSMKDVMDRVTFAKRLFAGLIVTSMGLEGRGVRGTGNHVSLTDFYAQILR